MKPTGFWPSSPWPSIPQNTGLSDLSGPSAIDDLKTLAVSRLMLDNIPHIKAFWVMLGPKLAQISLCFGVDDVDGTVMEERITHMAGAQTPQGLTRTQLRALIREAGCEPVERDTLYRVVIELMHAAGFPLPLWTGGMEGTSGRIYPSCAKGIDPGAADKRLDRLGQPTASGTWTS